MQETDALREAERLMVVCNSCRYCEGLCAVFPAMEMRRTFASADLNYLANLCHHCGACYHDCQFSPPHEFDVNVPRVLAQVRAQSYKRYAWPGALASLFDRNGLKITLVAAACTAVFVLSFVAWQDPAVVFGTHTGPGAFYRLMPHNAMVAVFGAAFAFALLAMAMSVAAFWRDMRAPDSATGKDAWQATQDTARLRYLDGGGMGCENPDERTGDRRRLFHHLTFYGFMLCFASTVVATLYHYVLGREAPYAWHEIPVLLGIAGGIGLLIGPAGLLAAKVTGDPTLRDEARRGMDTAFIVMLFLTAATGMLLLTLRHTSLMGMLLAAHLGVVLGLFLAMPYSKFVHGLYRFAALVRYAKERRGLAEPPVGE